MRTPSTDRGAYRIVAGRELFERLRDRNILISTVITVLVLVGVILANAVFSQDPRFDLGVVGSASGPVADDVAAAGRAVNVTISTIQLGDRGAAEASVRDGTVDAALVEGSEVVVESEAPAELVALIQAASARRRSLAALEDAGVDPERAASALNPPPLPVSSLEPPDPDRDANAAVAFVGVLLLYGQLFGYGYWVSSGVVEEKSSRVVEVLLATIRPSHLLAGKILGIGVLGLAQLVVIGSVALVTAQAAGVLDVPLAALATAGLVLAWFVLGFAFYSTLFAVAGSLVSRPEDLQSTITPLSVVIVGSLLVGLNALQNPDATLAVVASLLPPSAPLVMPSRIVLGQTSVWEVGLSILATAGAIAALIPLAARLYTGAVLRTGKVKLREAWRASG